MMRSLTLVQQYRDRCCPVPVPNFPGLDCCVAAKIESFNLTTQNDRAARTGLRFSPAASVIYG
jgi:hypothetical protein